MKSSTASAILSVAAMSSQSLAAFTMDIAKAPPGIPKLLRRNLSPRASVTESLVNNATGGSYMATVKVGTPGQQQILAIDTGSSDVWVLDVSADACTDVTIQSQAEDGCDSTFDPSKSSTFKDVLQDGFYIQYGDGSGAEGDYITDNLAIGGVTVKTLEMGLAYNATLFQGLLGIGYDTNEASDDAEDEQDPFIYPSIIDSMVSQGLISTKAYSLYLNDLQASTGSIIFGGMDSDKFHGDLLEMPIVPSPLGNGTSVYSEFTVALTSFSMTGQAGNTTSLTQGAYDAPVILDSGTTLTYVPQPLADLIYEKLNAVDDTQNSGLVFVDCGVSTNSPKTTFNFGFGGSDGVSIQIPIDEMVFSLDGLFSVDGSASPDLPFSNTCGLGINGQAEEPYILGDTFLRSAYVVYDLKNNVIAIAQTNFNSTTSSIIDFTADATAIPNVSGVASSVAVTETATGGLPVGGGHSATSSITGKPTASGASGSSSGSSSSSTSKSAAVGSVPAFDVTALAVFGLSGVFAVLGGGWFLA
ncbi:putative aspartic-type endopeptidase opsB [Hyphodiscus hymeniophilus]|uniref:Probable aspartic-type endopeptidase OPSB n=1 Tax=Hyphodiscus hymeniophilus TaxID=353542 RepID=A0A9P6VFA7_9HELO|nr:putative aspartic-type endopeptidase opsB [Hyphodiscus hymeniophilus]